MDIVGLLVLIGVLCLAFWAATWIVQSSFPADVRPIAMIIVGVLALAVLFGLVSGYIPSPRFR